MKTLHVQSMNKNIHSILKFSHLRGKVFNVKSQNEQPREVKSAIMPYKVVNFRRVVNIGEQST